MLAAAQGGSGTVIFEGSAPDHPAAYVLPIFGITGTETIDAWRRVIGPVAQTTDAMLLMQLCQIANPDFVARVRDNDIGGLEVFRKTVHLDVPASAPEGSGYAGS